MTAATPTLVLLGATGFVGRALLRQWRREMPDARIHVLCHRQPLAQRDDRVRVFHGDLRHLPPGLLPRRPHVVVHAATKQVDRDGSGYAVNEEGMQALLKGCNRHTQGVIYASSFSVYGDDAQQGVDESEELMPRGALAESRLKTERCLKIMAAQRDIPAVVLRTRFVLGEGDRYVLPGLRKLARRRIGVGRGDQRFSVIDVDDYARVIWQLAGQFAGGGLPAWSVYHAAYRQPLSLDEIMQAIRQAEGVAPPRFRLPVNRPLLAMLDCLPGKAVRQLAERLRLIGLDHYGRVDALTRRLSLPVLETNPQQVIQRLMQTQAETAAEPPRLEVKRYEHSQ